MGPLWRLALARLSPGQRRPDPAGVRRSGPAPHEAPAPRSQDAPRLDAQHHRDDDHAGRRAYLTVLGLPFDEDPPYVPVEDPVLRCGCTHPDTERLVLHRRPRRRAGRPAALDADITGTEAFIIAPDVPRKRALGPNETLVSIDKARRVLGYQPHFSGAKP
jgi:hypothetical protein